MNYLGLKPLGPLAQAEIRSVAHSLLVNLTDEELIHAEAKHEQYCRETPQQFTLGMLHMALKESIPYL